MNSYCIRLDFIKKNYNRCEATKAARKRTIDDAAPIDIMTSNLACFEFEICHSIVATSLAIEELENAALAIEAVIALKKQKYILNKRKLLIFFFVSLYDVYNLLHHKLENNAHS